MVRIEVVHVDVRHVLRLHGAVSQRIPIKIIEPRVCLQLCCAIGVANAIDGLPLEALVDEVGGSLVPPRRYVILLYLHLAEQDLIADVLSRAAFVWSLTHHALVCYNTDCKVIGRQPMVLPTHDFRRHVARCATCLTRVVWGEDSSHTEICQTEISFIIED